MNIDIWELAQWILFIVIACQCSNFGRRISELEEKKDSTRKLMDNIFHSRTGP